MTCNDDNMYDKVIGSANINFMVNKSSFSTETERNTIKQNTLLRNGLLRIAKTK